MSQRNTLVFKGLVYVFVFCFPILLAAQSGISLAEWRLSMLDDSLHKLPEFDDREWVVYDATRTDNLLPSEEPIWLRKTIYLQTSLQEKSQLQDSVRIILGEVTGVFELFVNGRLAFTGLGSNYPQRITLRAINSFLVWDDVNVLSLRLSPLNGKVGMSNCGCDVNMLDIPDFISLDTKVHLLKPVPGGYTKKVTMFNNYSLPLYGTVILRVVEAGRPEPLFEETKRITIPRNGNVSHTFTLPDLKSGQIEYYFVEEKSNKSIKMKGEKL